MKALNFSCAAAFAALLVFAPGAQAQGVTGKWNVEYDMRIRSGMGGDEVEERGKARLTLEQHGDSVTGTWLMTSPAPPPGTAAQPLRTIRGTVSGKTVKFSSGPAEATINRNGDITKVQVMTDYEATIDGDTLAGTMTSHALDSAMAGMSMNRKFDGVRDRS
jgi:hypothetical protein